MTSDEEWLHFFEKQARHAFDFLVAGFGFSHSGSAIRPPECWTAYENSTTCIVIAFELGVGPRVEIQRKQPSLLGFGSRERYDLAFLLMERAAGEKYRYEIADLDDPELPNALQALAHQLERFGKDILSGDFSVFPQLRKQAEENFKRTNRELYGP